MTEFEIISRSLSRAVDGYLAGDSVEDLTGGSHLLTNDDLIDIFEARIEEQKKIRSRRFKNDIEDLGEWLADIKECNDIIKYLTVIIDILRKLKSNGIC